MDKVEKPVVSIVILNYKRAGLVKQCIKGIVKLAAVPYEIIVVDNNSQDDIEKVVDQFYQVRLIKAKKNRGFAAGNNLGIKQAQGEFIMIINPDIAVLEGSIEAMVQFLEQHPEAGMVVPQLLNPDGSIQMSVMRFPTLLIPLYRRTWLERTKKGQSKLDWYLLREWDHQSIREIEWALGACMMVRRQALNEVGLMDERYFLYVEDTDWCRRFWQQGWKIYYLPSAKMVHYHARESAGKFLSKLNIVHLISWFKYFWKFRKDNTPSLIDKKASDQ